MPSLHDLDGLALSLVAEHLPLQSVVVLASMCRHFYSSLAGTSDDGDGDDGDGAGAGDRAENPAFWRRIAGEVWGVQVDAPAAVPHLPGGAGAGLPARSWRETCVAHSRLLSRYGRDAGTRASRAWHRIEAALAATAPDVLATLAPGRTLPLPLPRLSRMPAGIHPEVLAAAAIHDGQGDFAAGLGPSCSRLELRRRAQLGLLGTAVVYGQGHSRWMRNLLPENLGEPQLQIFLPVAEKPPPGGSSPLRLHEFVISLSALDPTSGVDLQDVEGTSALALELDSAAVYVRSVVEVTSPPRRIPAPVKRADRGRGLLFFLGELASALETRQLGPERDSFFRRGGAMEVQGLPRPPLQQQQRRSPPQSLRCLSRFAEASPGMASRVTAGALVVSRAALPAWVFQVRTTTDASGNPSLPLAMKEFHMFCYRVRFKLLSTAEQKRQWGHSQLQEGQGQGLRQQQQQPLRVIRRANLISRHWETIPVSPLVEREVVNGEGVVGFTPTLVANDDDDGDDDGGGDDDGDDASSFCYCSRVMAPPLVDAHSRRACTPPYPPGTLLGSFGGHFVFQVSYEDGTAAAHVEVPVEPLDLRVPMLYF